MYTNYTWIGFILYADHQQQYYEIPIYSIPVEKAPLK